jgi:SRSO17 transposase
MRKEYIELYTDYLIASFGKTTATGLSALLDGEISHDKITRFLGKEEYTSKELWKLVKKEVREIEEEDGVLIFDDTVQEKQYSKESELICWHYDHTFNRNIKGINLLNCIYHANGVSLPIAFELVKKPIQFSDLKTKEQKRKSEVTKNEMLRAMLKTAQQNQVKWRYILADS